MKRKMVYLLNFVLLLAASSVLAQSGGGYDVEWNVFSSAGEQFVTSADYQLGFTLAQDTPPLVSVGGDYQIVQGYWQGTESGATAVILRDLWAEARGDTLVVGWETVTEVDTLGFNILRSDSGESGSFSRRNEDLILGQSPGSPAGASYEWVDAEVEAGSTYFYLLEAMDVHGRATVHGPVAARLRPAADHRTFLPLMNR